MPRRIGLGLRADPIPSTNSSKAQGCKPGSLDDEQTEIVHEDIMTKPGTSRDKKNNDQKAILDYFSLKALNIKKKYLSKENPDILLFARI